MRVYIYVCGVCINEGRDALLGSRNWNLKKLSHAVRFVTEIGGFPVTSLQGLWV